jgi:methylenetetrahydrofolate dehydrogenase (NADP+) / methenyltetrahydrofolate cyclohydrolase
MGYNLLVKLFDGKKEAQKLDLIISEAIKSTLSVPGLAIVQVGENKESEKYANLKVNYCKSLGIPIVYKKIDASNLDSEILNEVKGIFADETTGGAIVQLPLPRSTLDEVLGLIPFERDVDIISPQAQERFYSGRPTRLMPVVRALKHFLDSYGIEIKDLKTVVIGKGFLVGSPVCHYLQQLGAKVTVIDKYNKNNSIDCQLAVLSAGIPNLVSGADIVNNCHVVDFGSSVVDGMAVGDLDMKSKLDHLGFVSASPGGMGPLSVRYLIMNLLKI